MTRTWHMAAMGILLASCGSSGSSTGAGEIPGGGDAGDGGAPVIPGGPPLRWLAYEAVYADGSVKAIELVRLEDVASPKPLRLEGEPTSTSFALPTSSHLFYDANYSSDGRSDTFAVDLRSATPKAVALKLPLRARLDYVQWREGAAQVLVGQSLQLSPGRAGLQRALSLVSTDALDSTALPLGDASPCTLSRDFAWAVCGEGNFSVIDLRTTPTAKTFTVSGGITLRDPPTLFGEGSKVIHAGQAGGTTSPLELYRSDAAAPGAKPEQLTDAATTVSTVFVSRDGARIACGFQSVHGIATDGPLPVKPTLIAQDVTHGGFFGDGKRLVWTTAPSGGRIRFETADLAGPPPWTPAIVLDAALSSSGTTTSALRSGLRELVLVQGSLFLVDASGALSVKEIATGVFSAAWAGKNIVYTTGNVGTTEVSLFAPDDGSRRSLSAGVANVKPGSVFPTTDVGTIGFVVSEPDGKESVYAVDLASPKPLRVTTAALRSAKGVALR